MKKLIAALAVAAAMSVSAAAQPGRDPFVFVSATEADGTPVTTQGLTWYLLPMSIRPTGTIVAGVPIAAMNALRERQEAHRPAISVDAWCFANALSERSYVSPSRVVQANIEQSFRNNPDHHFSLRGRFTGGAELTAIVGHFESCNGETGSFILIVDTLASAPIPVFVDTLPYESGLQYMRLVDGNITVSTCFECGDVTGLFYDLRRRRWYWEMLGD